MTVAVAIRVPGVGCVIGSDGRITEDCAILADSFVKWSDWGGLVSCWAGDLAKKTDLDRAPPADLDALRAKLRTGGGETSVLVYDRAADRLTHTGSDAWLIPVASHWAIGSGGNVALGFLDGQRPAADLKSAAGLALRALRAAVRRRSSCGGRLRVVQVPHDRRRALVVT